MAGCCNVSRASQNSLSWRVASGPRPLHRLRTIQYFVGRTVNRPQANNLSSLECMRQLTMSREPEHPYKNGNETGSGGKWAMTLRIRLLLLVLLATLRIGSHHRYDHRPAPAPEGRCSAICAEVCSLRCQLPWFTRRRNAAVAQLMVEMPQVRELKTQDCNTLWKSCCSAT